MSIEVTDDMLRLLLVIKEYTSSDHASTLDWVKELPLMAVIYQGIIDGIFQDYDYAPWSVSMLDGTRQWLNVSREGKDDLEDLLDLRNISMLRLSTSQYGFLTAYRLTKKGEKVARGVDPALQSDVQRLVRCECGGIKHIIIENRKFFFECTVCNKREQIHIDQIEDLAYTTRVYIPDYLRSGGEDGGRKK
ncbi:MAG: hypothetical protein ACFFF4_01910 [Candidatus Thorarchaeota archaeon]